MYNKTVFKISVIRTRSPFTVCMYVFVCVCAIYIEDQAWGAYKKEDGHYRDGFRQFFTRFAE